MPLHCEVTWSLEAAFTFLGLEQMSTMRCVTERQWGGLRPSGAPVLTSMLVWALGCSGSPHGANDSPVVDPTTTSSTVTVPAPVAPGSSTVTPGTTATTTPTTEASVTIPPSPAPPTCQGEPVTDSKRIVRLSFNQISRTLHALLGDELGAAVDAKFEIGVDSPVARTFPPLASAQEGSTITTGLWQKVDLVAQYVAEHVRANISEVTSCAEPLDDACAQDFVEAFAERAYRRPITASEASSLGQVYEEVKAIYGTAPDALQFAVYAIMQSQQFLYRTELGDSPTEAGRLTPYEIASALSYFLTDGPPDAALLEAAAMNALATREQVGAQVDRILATEVAQTNLTSALFSYFQLDTLATVKIDNPAFTSGTPERPYTGVRESAYHELELFLGHTLWHEPLTAVLTSKTSFINETLAPLYGVTLPAGGGGGANQFAEERFVETQLPDNRSGILTSVGFLASNSRPDVPSVVARGLVVNKALLCQSNPPFPEQPELTALIEEAGLKLATASERERSDYRIETSPCASCHVVFDAYGLALDSYDIVGRYRTEDPEGRPIDPSVTLPPLFDNEVAGNAVEMQAKIASNPGFDACFTRNMLNWAMAEGSQLTPTSCATEAIVNRYLETDRTLSSLLREVAMSESFTQRNAGVTP